MARAKKKAASTSTSTGDHHYKKVDELPEERRKAYESILEDFDKQGDFYIHVLLKLIKFSFINPVQTISGLY
jgi:hypothetical protein